MKFIGTERLLFFLSAAFFVFLYGFLTYHYDLFPSDYLKRAVEKAVSFARAPIGRTPVRERNRKQLSN